MTKYQWYNGEEISGPEFVRRVSEQARESSARIKRVIERFIRKEEVLGKIASLKDAIEKESNLKPHEIDLLCDKCGINKEDFENKNDYKNFGTREG